MASARSQRARDGSSPSRRRAESAEVGRFEIGDRTAIRAEGLEVDGDEVRAGAELRGLLSRGHRRRQCSGHEKNTEADQGASIGRSSVRSSEF